MISDEIQRYAEIHEISISKAMDEFFKVYPEKHPLWRAESSDKKQQVAEDRRERDYVNGKVDHKIWMVARRENLNPENPADRAKATDDCRRWRT